MIGEKLRQRRSQTRVFLVLYAGLALLGCWLAAGAIARGQGSANVAGFMVVFGTGMFVLTLVKSRKPQVLVHEDFLEVAQGRSVETVRYRNLTSVSRPDRNRITATLREDGALKSVVIWTRELEPADVERLYDFLAKAKGRRK